MKRKFTIIDKRLLEDELAGIAINKKFKSNRYILIPIKDNEKIIKSDILQTKLILEIKGE